MSVKAVLRYVTYVMRRHPSAETTATARCLNPECRWTSEPTGNADVCTDMCIQHTGRTGHMTFLREFSEVAVVERISSLRGTTASYGRDPVFMGQWQA
ncbi:hypothetical protein ACIQV2_00655 [Streptomyces globosus]|uniref:DUF7848 domain-containing protein n=1 Tax=Streptomyces globosus TaxID=68209 RepID=UPI0038007C82